MDQKTTDSARLAKYKRRSEKRLKRGEAQAQVMVVIETLKMNKGRWHKIHKAHCRPGYLYQFNKNKSRLDERVTLRYAAQVERGETSFYYAMVLHGGIVNSGDANT